MELQRWISLLALVAICQSEHLSTSHENKGLQPQYIKVSWMASVPNQTLLSAVSIPGTHQSLKNSGAPFSRFQSWDLHNQLYAGIRFFDMDLRRGIIPDGNIYVKTVPLIGSERFSDALSFLKGFLKVHRTETLLLRVTPDKDAVAMVTEMLSHDDVIQIWREQKTPTMEGARGKLVLVQSSTLTLGISVDTTFLQGKQSKEQEMKENINKASENCKLRPKLTDVGAKGTFENPLTVAQTLNKQIDDHLNLLLGDTNMYYCVGIVALDFPGPKLIQTIIEFNCKLVKDTGKGEAEYGGTPDGAVGEGGVIEEEGAVETGEAAEGEGSIEEGGATEEIGTSEEGGANEGGTQEGGATTEGCMEKEATQGGGATSEGTAEGGGATEKDGEVKGPRPQCGGETRVVKKKKKCRCVSKHKH